MRKYFALVLLILSAFAVAQIPPPPPGPGAATTNRQIPATNTVSGTPTPIFDSLSTVNLVHQWRARQGVHTSNGQVTQWDDLVGGANLTPYVAGQQPTLVNDQYGPAVQFSANAHPYQLGLLYNSTIQTNAQNFYAYAIIEYVSGITPNTIFNFGNDSQWLLISTDNTNSASCLRIGSSGGTSAFANQYVPHGRSLVGVIGPSTGTAITFVNDHIASNSTTFPTATWTGFGIGNTIASLSSWGTYKVYEVGIYSVSQPAFGLQSQITALTNYAENYGVIRNQTATSNVVFSSDSITSSVASNSQHGWNQRDLLGLTQDTQTYNLSYSGRLASAVNDATALASLKNTNPGAKNFYIYGPGTNDLAAASGQEPTLQTTATTNISAAIAQGYQVIACTLLPRAVGANASFEADRQTYNTWLRANYVALGCVDLIDFGNNSSVMGAPGAYSNTALYYTDGVHPIDPGYRYMAAVARPVLARNLYPGYTPTTDARYGKSYLTPRLRIVSRFGGWINPIGNNLSNGTTQLTGTDRVAFKVFSNATDLQFLYVNGYSASSGIIQPVGNALQFNSVLDAAPNLINIPFQSYGTAAISSGGHTGTWIGDGQWLLSNPLNSGLFVPGSNYFIRTYKAVTTGQKWPLSYQTSQPGFATSGSTTDVVYGSTNTTGADVTQSYGSFGANFASTAYLWAPSAIIGRVQPSALPVIAAMGDSISSGYGSTVGNGYILQAVTNAGLNPYSAGTSGATLANLGTYGNMTPVLARYVDYIVLHAGVNDYAAGGYTTLAQYQVALLKWCQIHTASGTKAIICTILPDTTSTDTFATTTNQTVATWDAVRVQVNNWLRDTGPSGMLAYMTANLNTMGSVIGICDGCTAVEYNTAGSALAFTGVDSAGRTTQQAATFGVWKANGTASYYTADGTHPSSNAVTLLAPTVPTSLMVAY